MSAELLRAFDLADSDTRENVLFGIVERVSDDELEYLQAAIQRLGSRFDILCGVSKGSGIQMPYEIQLQIIYFLDITDLYYCTNVSRRWRDLILRCEQLVDDLLKKWFPTALDDKAMPPSQKSKILQKAIRKRHLRDSARFRTRFTCGFFKKSNGVFPVDRVEGLQRGQTFKDLACSASMHGWAPDSILAHSGMPRLAGPASNISGGSFNGSHEISGGVVSKCLYAHGRIAWQIMPALGEWVYSINVHDFRTHRRWEFSLPSMRTRGIKLALLALGRDLVVARVIGGRDLYAWDLRSHAVDHVTLQNPPNNCFTEHRSVVIVTQSGELLLWSFGHGLADIDTAIPQDGAVYQGPAKPEFSSDASLPASEMRHAKVLFHPEDEDVFFMAKFEETYLASSEVSLLWVYEFRNKQYSRIFTCSVPPSRRLWIGLEAVRADAHGTYQLLEERSPSGGGVQVNCITFNTMSQNFDESLRFQAPLNAESESTLVWNEHLIFRHFHPNISSIRPCLLSVAPKQCPDHHSPETVLEAVRKVMESMMTSVISSEDVDSSVSPNQSPRNSTHELQQEKPRYDVARSPDISRRYPSMPDLGAAAGLRSILSFHGGPCSWEGSHVRECPKASGLSMPERNLYPINYFAHNTLQDEGGIWASQVFADDDFLVVITNRGFYTVLAVDEDGKMSRGMLRDGVTQSAEDRV